MMKKQFSYLLVFLVLWGCKKREETPTYLELNDLYEFRVEGVPQENISVENSTLRIQLPSDYRGGNRLQVYFRDQEKILAKPQTIEYGWQGNEIAYEGRLVRLQNLVFDVIPAKPLELLSQGKPYLFNPDGSEKFVSLSARNWGSLEEPSPSDTLAFKLVEKKTGKVVHTTALRVTPPAAAGGPTTVEAALPVFLDAGEYQIMVRRRGKEYVGPDALLVSYGEPALNRYGSTALLAHGNRQPEFRGKNLLPGHDYQLVLSNDFGPSQRFALTPKNPVTLTTILPTGLPEGNYEAKLYIDGALQDTTGLFGVDNLLIVQETTNLPHLYSLTDSSQKYLFNGKESDFSRPITTFKRGQRIKAITFTPPNATSWDYIKLTLTEVGTRKEWVLDNEGAFAGGIVYFRPLFKIPLDVTPGRYEVKYSMKSNGGEVVTSARYHRIITVE